MITLKRTEHGTDLTLLAEDSPPSSGADVAWLVKRVRELEGHLNECILQIMYLHEGHGETGSGNAVLSRARAVLLAKADQEDPV